jgi:hypothetical protein
MEDHQQFSLDATSQVVHRLNLRGGMEKSNRKSFMGWLLHPKHEKENTPAVIAADPKAIEPISFVLEIEEPLKIIDTKSSTVKRYRTMSMKMMRGITQSSKKVEEVPLKETCMEDNDISPARMTIKIDREMMPISSESVISPKESKKGLFARNSPAAMTIKVDTEMMPTSSKSSIISPKESIKGLFARKKSFRLKSKSNSIGIENQNVLQFKEECHSKTTSITQMETTGITVSNIPVMEGSFQPILNNNHINSKSIGQANQDFPKIKEESLAKHATINQVQNPVITVTNAPVMEGSSLPVFHDDDLIKSEHENQNVQQYKQVNLAKSASNKVIAIPLMGGSCQPIVHDDRFESKSIEHENQNEPQIKEANHAKRISNNHMHAPVITLTNDHIQDEQCDISSLLNLTDDIQKNVPKPKNSKNKHFRLKLGFSKSKTGAENFWSGLQSPVLLC